ncbi:MAG: orotate phosphoribosyltransferase [Candidatus Bathyarchaeia archaeon]
MVEAKETEAMRTELCRILNKIGALEFGTFKLTTGRTSPYYIDLRIVPSFPDAFRRVCDLYLRLIRGDVGDENFDRIAGIPTAGIPFASFLAYQLKKPFLYTRPQKRLHGREKRVEGIIIPGDRVLLIDDLITTGRSLMKTAAAIRAEGGVVSDAVVLLDREEGGREKLTEDGVRLHSLLKASEAAEKLYQMGAITEDQLRTIKKQVKKK